MFLQKTDARANSAHRPGAATVALMALLIGVLITMVAFGVDLGYIANVNCQLQNDADSGALAAASQILYDRSNGVDYLVGDRGELHGNPDQTARIAAARAMATTFGGYNKAGGVSLVVDGNADVSLGYIADPRNASSPMQTNQGLLPTQYSPLLLWLPSVANPYIK